MTLFKITARWGYKSKNYESYYVLAKDSADAEKKVINFHKKQDYPSVDFCHSETIAQSGIYGRPLIFLQ
jgi:hypothetical protein